MRLTKTERTALACKIRSKALKSLGQAKKDAIFSPAIIEGTTKQMGLINLLHPKIKEEYFWKDLATTRSEIAQSLVEDQFKTVIVKDCVDIEYEIALLERDTKSFEEIEGKIKPFENNDLPTNNSN